MEKKSKCKFSQLLQSTITRLPSAKKYLMILDGFYQTYQRCIEDDETEKLAAEATFCTFLDLILLQLEAPYPFEHYHKQLKTPFDYYEFGLNFLKPLVKMPQSVVLGEENLVEMDRKIKAKENIFLLANHQTESDPVALALLLEKKFPHIIKSLISIAGERVVIDPLAVPFSLGCNLLCIYSKRYIDNPPEQKHAKQLHNKKTMSIMSDLLSEGGHVIYVAPSGGRDRKNKEGVIEVAPFDPQSIEMLHLMSQQAKKKVHFHPLALATYNVMPPPEAIQVELGEKRITNRVPIGAYFGNELNMTSFPGSELENKHERREAKARFIEQQVKEGYQTLCKLLHIPC